MLGLAQVRDGLGQGCVRSGSGVRARLAWGKVGMDWVRLGHAWFGFAQFRLGWIWLGYVCLSQVKPC